MVSLTTQLSNRQKRSGLLFNENNTIRVVYCTEELRKIDFGSEIYELPISYEKQIEYTESNPSSKYFRDQRYVYSLENAFLWLPKNDSQFAIIATCDFVSVKPIIKYIRNRLNITYSLPDLSQEMLINIASGSTMRNATFGINFKETDSAIDSKSLTIYDDAVAETKIYKSI